MRLKTISTLIIIFSLVQLKAQIAVNEWRTHFSFNNMKEVVEGDEKIYGVGKGGFMYFDKSDNSSSILTRIDKLSENIPNTVFYDFETEMLFIGYGSGMLDVIKKGNFMYFTELKRKTSFTNKTINHITRYNGAIYLSCGFGILEFDPDINLFTKTIFIGDGGTQINVLKLIEGTSKLYALTKEGVYAIEKTDNIEDYRNWHVINHFMAEYSVTNIAWYNNKLWATGYNLLSEKYDLINIDESSYTVNSLVPEAYNLNLSVTNNYLNICHNGRAKVYNQNLELVIEKVINMPQDAIMDREGQLWIADLKSGIYGINKGKQVRGLPNGPRFSIVGDVVYNNNTVYVCGGNKSNLYSRKGYYLFKDEKWESFYNIDNDGDYEPIWPNILSIVVDPNNPDRMFASSERYGLIEFIDNVPVNFYDNMNSTLTAVDGIPVEDHDVRIVGMAFDSKGNLWVATNLTVNPINVLTTDNEWHTVSLDYNNVGRDKSAVTGLVIDDYDQKWLLVKNHGVLVFKETDDTYQDIDEKAITVTNQGGLSKTYIYCAKKDNDGNICIGTDKGPVIYSNVGDILSSSNPYGYQTKIPRNDGTPLADYLLETVKIVDLDFDGANRMWVATESAGAFLISEDGVEEIHHFTTDNSPFASNYIIAVEVNDHTGEVFFTTNDGILSYRGNSTLGGSSFGDVYVYPNPVRPEYDGNIYIAELAQNANVKITDISGNLVFETTALGSQAEWDGYDLWGNRVNTGVYLVFCTNEDATESVVTKLLFIK